MIAGPLNAIVALWPAAANLVQTLPAAAGLAYSSGAVDDGLVPSLRRRWEPALRDPVVMAALLGWIGALWILRLVDVVNGYVLIIGAVAGILAARSWGVSRQREAPAEREIPVEWWGLERPWTTEDEEVLDRAIAARS